jgi:hypothetical protein
MTPMTETWSYGTRTTEHRKKKNHRSRKYVSGIIALGYPKQHYTSLKGYINALAEEIYRTIKTYNVKLPNNHTHKPTSFKKASNLPVP